jgi:hypothetical protein
LEATRDQQVTFESFDNLKMFPQNDYASGRYIDSYDNSLDFSRLDQFRIGTTPGVSKRFAILFGDRDTADRVAKAFAHSIELCGGKKEPF